MMPEDATKEITLERVLEQDNLRAAWLAVKANGGAPGVDGMDIGETEHHLRDHWDRIEAKLRAGDYHPGAVRAVAIPKGSGGTRTLGIPNVLDRMIQQAIHQVMGPAWEPDFSEHSHGFRPGRSAHDAVREALVPHPSRENVGGGHRPEELFGSVFILHIGSWAVLEKLRLLVQYLE